MLGLVGTPGVIQTYRFLGPVLRLFPPEAAHELALWALEHDLVPAAGAPVAAGDLILACRRWGLDFANPIGLAAGFDKNARVIEPMTRLGFGFVEIGTVTPKPQAGNPKPRLFRLPADEAVINRLGFNSEGCEAVIRRLAARRPAGIVGFNLGRNRETDDEVADYVEGVRAAAGLADYLVLNISSPNTPGLRDLQAGDRLNGLIERVLAARNAAVPASGPPVLVKIAPDLGAEERREVSRVALASGVDGMIIGNTTTDRPPELRSRDRAEQGGLSGPPLLAPSTAMLAEIYCLTEGKLPLVGCGGVSNGRDAYAKIRAGASLVQLFTALVYHGPGLVSRLAEDLAACLRADGFDSVDAAIGADVA